MASINHRGCHLYYEVTGPENAQEAVFFLNGVMASASSWAYQAGVLEKHGYRVIVHDFRGQLKSDKPKGPYTFRMHADDVAAILSHLSIETAHFIGTSYGGEVGMCLALDYPKRVKSLALINTVSELDDTLKKHVINWKKLAALYDAEKFFWGMASTIYHPRFLKQHEKDLQKRVAAMKTLSSDYFDGQIALYDTFLQDLNITEKLQEIQCPTLIVCGEDDQLKPAKFSRIIADKIKQSEYFIIPDCAHVTIFEKPFELNTLILGFLKKLA